MKDQKEIINENKENFVVSLAQKIGITTNAKYIYGEPVERDGVTVITVAKAVYGFGGCSGKNDADEGSGGGVGVVLTPVGYIEIKNGETRFRPTRDWLLLVPALAAAAPVILYTGWKIAGLFGRKKGGGKNQML
ncbi:MAG TPA: spore germination protein GerW family protein [Pyrinomonadaceae bacterium]|nr:spore germination protein GerW family protein [Pyrinomonadaceae bacterium]